MQPAPSFSNPRFWTPQDSPGLFLEFLGISFSSGNRKGAAHRLREALALCSDSDLEDLAQKVASHRRAGGNDPMKTFREVIDFLKQEREAALYPQMN